MEESEASAGQVHSALEETDASAGHVHTPLGETNASPGPVHFPLEPVHHPLEEIDVTSITESDAASTLLPVLAKFEESGPVTPAPVK